MSIKDLLDNYPLMETLTVLSIKRMRIYLLLGIPKFKELG